MCLSQIHSEYCKFGTFRGFFYLRLRSFVKIKPSRNDKSTLSFTDVGKSCPSRVFLTLQICLLTLSSKIKFSRKFPNLQYIRLSTVAPRVKVTSYFVYNC